MNYKLVLNSENILWVNEEGVILKYIPADPGNRDWQAYQAWLEADPENEPLPADEE